MSDLQKINQKKRGSSFTVFRVMITVRYNLGSVNPPSTMKTCPVE